MGLREGTSRTDDAITQAVIRLFISQTGDINTETLDVLVAALDQRIGCLMDEIIHINGYQQMKPHWRKVFH
ncbi:hypothetical protein DQC86_11425 [Salmonella enterica subsp. enterica]|nr:hypothetical protein [Salmonella enterica subsp. enterica]